MFVGSALVELELPAGGSLKDKRRVVKGLTARIRRRFEVACSEVARMDDHRRATLGVALVSNDPGHISAVLSRIESWLARAPDSVLLEFTVRVS